MSEPREVLVDTPKGPGRLTVAAPAGDPVGVLALGHGAGGLTWSRDLLAVRDAALDAGWVVGLVDQPWRVAGRKVATPPPSLDLAWVPLVEALVGMPSAPLPLVVAGRSAGARVACRTADRLEAAAVLAISFPLHPPGRPDRSRADELRAPGARGIPVLVVQGEKDPFGTPAEVEAVRDATTTLAPVPGTHTPSSPPAVAAAALALLGTVLQATRGE